MNVSRIWPSKHSYLRTANGAGAIISLMMGVLTTLGVVGLIVLSPKTLHFWFALFICCIVTGGQYFLLKSRSDYPEQTAGSDER